MTSTISSINKKNSFLGLCKWSFFRCVPLFVVYCCVLALVLPMFIFITIADENYSYANEVFSTVVPAVEVVFVVCFGVSLFKDFHDKRSVDLYMAFPVKKVTMFAARYVSGLVMLIVPLLIFTLLSGAVTQCFPTVIFDAEESYGLITPYTPYILSHCGVMTVSVISAYSMLTVVALLCGTVLSTVISYGIVNVLYPVFLIAMETLFVSTIPGFEYVSNNGINPVDGLFYVILSPNLSLILSGTVIQTETDYYSTAYNYNYDVTLGSYLVFHLIFIAVMIGAGCLIAKRRKNENVQNSFINPIIKSVVTVFIVVASAILTGWIFKEMFYSSIQNNEIKATPVFLIGCIIGGTLAFLIFTFLYNKGVRGFVKSLPVLGVSLGVVFVSVLLIVTGFFGRDTYVPDESKIESVAVVNGYMDCDLCNQLSMKEYFKNGKSSQEYEYMNCEYYYDENDIAQVMDYQIKDKEVIAKTVQLHKLLIENVKAEHGWFYDIGSANITVDAEYIYDEITGESYRKPDDFSTSIQIQYKLKNGKIINRFYQSKYTEGNQITALENEIMSTDVYKETCFAFVKSGEKHLAYIDTQHLENHFATYDGQDHGIVIQDRDKMKQLYNAFITDFMNDKNVMETILHRQKINTQRFTEGNVSPTEDIVIGISFEQKKIKSNDEDIYADFYEKFWHITQTYTNTLKLQKEYSNGKVFSGESMYISR